MQKVKKILASISITWVMLFSLRVVTIPTPVSLPEQFALVMVLIEYSFYKTKQLGENEESKRLDKND